MTLETDLRAAVLADAAVSARIDERMYPAAAPQGVTYPFLTYQTISAVRFYHLGGKSNLASPRVQIDAWALTALEAWQLAAEVRAVLEVFRGLLNGTTYVQRIMLDNEQDMPPESGIQPDERIYRRSQDYLVFFRET